MPSDSVLSFEAQVIQDFRVPLAGRAGPLDYVQYLSLPSAARAGDEAAVVDSIFSTAVLSWLGFQHGRGDWVYNRSQVAGSVIRPDFVVNGPNGTAFIWESKATTEEFTSEHRDQMRKYMRGLAGYAVWSNARRILALHFDTAGRSAFVADIAVDVLFGSRSAAPEEQLRCDNALQLFKVLFSKSRFFDFDQLVQRVACDETTYLANATSLATTGAQGSFIADSRTVLDRLRLAALTQIQAAKVWETQRSTAHDALMSEWASAEGDLYAALAPVIRAVIEPRLGELRNRLGALHGADILTVVEAARVTYGRGFPVSQAQALSLWAERATRINNAFREVRMSSTGLAAIPDAFMIWRERQPDARLASEEVFAEQVAYVFFVRLLLTRILEDKQLLPTRIASNGGFQAWRDLMATYFDAPDGDIHSTSFMQLLSERVSTFYQHFFRQPLFDWFLPDDYLILITLDFLSRYSFSTIDSDLLGFTYEQYIDRVARNKKGHFLTRPPVVDYMLDALDYRGPQIIGRKILDPACGSGSFLVHAARRLKAELNLAIATRFGVSATDLPNYRDYYLEYCRSYVTAMENDFVGMDLEPFACYLAEINLLIQCLDELHFLWINNEFQPIESFRIFNTDSLDLPESIRSRSTSVAQSSLGIFSMPPSATMTDPSYALKAREGDYRQGFYYVICNPPYVDARHETISTDYSTLAFFSEALAGSLNLYLLFLRLGLHFMAVGGRMAFIVPLTVFGDQSAKAIRGLLDSATHHPYFLTRFYRGDVLFPGVDQAVAVLAIEHADSPSPTIQIAGGSDVPSALTSAVVVARSHVLSRGPTGGNWEGAWLVSPDSDAYDVWLGAQRAEVKKLADLWGGIFDIKQGDLKAFHLNPFRLGAPQPSAVAAYKGESVFRFAPLPVPPPDWAMPRSSRGVNATENRVNSLLTTLSQLAAPEDGFVLREVGRLNTRDELKATWFVRDASRPIIFTNELWRFRRIPKAPLSTAKAVFGLVASQVMCYLYNLFSTNNHVALGQLQSLPVPDPAKFDIPRISAIVDELITCRASLQQAYALYGAKFPDTDGVLSISPGALLIHSRLPSVSLAALVLRGQLCFTGNNRTMRGTAVPGRLTTPRGSPLSAVLPLFMDAHSQERWGNAATAVSLPEPSIALLWLQQFQAINALLAKDWDNFKKREQDLDEAVSDWYGFNSTQRAAIARGLPWTRA